MEAFDERYFVVDDEFLGNDEAYGGLDITANVLKAWFAECWWKAGGWSYPIPVSVNVHDEFGDGRSIALTESR